MQYYYQNGHLSVKGAAQWDVDIVAGTYHVRLFVDVELH